MFLINGTRNPFEDFIHAARRPYAESGKIAKIHSRCLLALEDSDLSNRLLDRIEERLNSVLQQAQLHRHHWQNYSALTDRRNGRSKVSDASALLECAIHELHGYLPLIPLKALSGDSEVDQVKLFRPDGYCASELKNEAVIKRTLWQKIRRSANVQQTMTGIQSRRFGMHEIRCLADAADALDTIKARYAAKAWRKLIEPPVKCTTCGS